METLIADTYQDPFPHAIIKNFYNQEELKLIWEELNFYTKPNKLLQAKDYGGVIDRTNAKAIALDSIYSTHRELSNILTVNRKLFEPEILEAFSSLGGCCTIAKDCNWDITKVRYYHNGEYYEPHADIGFQFLAFSYFYREPKKFEGGQLYFPKYNYEVPCTNNSMIILPGWVKHGVKKVSIKNSDYYDGWGRYCISSFFCCANGLQLEQAAVN